MDAAHEASAAQVRARILEGVRDPTWFRDRVRAIPYTERDAWVDRVLGTGAIPDDDPALPRGCVPYLPCAVEDLVAVAEHVRASDVFVDVGAGIGRAAAFVHLYSGATVIGVEIQPQLARAATNMHPACITMLEGDACELVARLTQATVFFLYCPFSGARLARLLDAIEPIARAKPLRIACVDLPLPPRDWLALESSPRVGVDLHRTRGS